MSSRRALLQAAGGGGAAAAAASKMEPPAEAVNTSPCRSGVNNNPFEVTMIDHTGRHAPPFAGDHNLVRRGSGSTIGGGGRGDFERRPSTTETSITAPSASAYRYSTGGGGGGGPLGGGKQSFTLSWYKVGIALLVAAFIYYHSASPFRSSSSQPVDTAVSYEAASPAAIIIEKQQPPDAEEIESLIQSYLPGIVQDLRGEIQTKQAVEAESVRKLKDHYQRLQDRMEANLARFKDYSDRLQSIERSKPAEDERSAAYEAELRARDVATDQLQQKIFEMAEEMKALRKQSGEVEDRLYEALRQEELMKKELESIRRAQEMTPPPTPAPLPVVKEIIKEIVTPVEPEETEDVGANFALSSLGAAVVMKFTTRPARGGDKNLIAFSRKVARFVPTGRYASVAESDVKDADIMLDETAIRGPGDCYTVSGKLANVTVHLPYPIIVKAFEVEHVRRNLDQFPECAPLRVDIFGTRVNPQHRTLPMSATSSPPTEVLGHIDTDFVNNHIARQTFVSEDKNTKYQRVRFEFAGGEEATSLCIYRVRVFGVVQPDNM